MLPRLVIALALLVAGAHASAQTYPNRPVRIIVAFAPGTTSDIIGRIFAEKLTQSMGQTFIVENRTGAGGTIGAEAAAKSPPDGYTLFLAGVATHGINPNLRKKLPYDAIKDFAAVSMIPSAPVLVAVHTSLPANSV